MTSSYDPSRRTFIAGTIAATAAIATGSALAKEDPFEEARAAIEQSPMREEIAKRLAAQRPIDHQKTAPKPRNWILGFGPFLNVQPGEIKKVDVQPKCLIKCKTVMNTGDHEDVYLRAIYVGKEEQLKLDRPIPFSDYLTGKGLTLSLDFKACDPAITLQIEFENRSTEPRTVSLSIIGAAVL